jgi:4-amino-4-deoxy-L-arabinose transferase-like glycosyltransferase
MSAAGPAVPGRRALAALLAGAALLLLGSLALFPLFNDDEGAFTEATRELLQSGDWISTTLNGAPRYDKPILIYWLQALSVQAFGLNEFALRLPSALAALAWVLAIARFAMPRLGATRGLLAAWICATSLGVLALGRAATADALLNALIAATMFDLWRHAEGVLAGGPGHRAALRRAYLWMGLGLLTKGPIALLIPGAVGLGLALLAGPRRAALLRAAADPLGWLLLLGVAAPWYAAMWQRHGSEFTEGFLVHHNLERFHGPLEGHGGSLLYYVLWVPVLLLPWSGLLWRGARGAWERRGEPLTRFLLLWFGFVFVFFSLSGTKLPHYALYGLTPLYLLLAARLPEDGRAANALGAPLVLLLLALALPAALAAGAGVFSEHLPPMYLAQFLRARAVTPAAYYPVLGACALAALGALLWRRPPPWQRAVAASAALALGLCFALTPWVGRLLSQPVKDAALLARQRPEPAVQWNFSAPSFSVYRGQVTPARPPQPGELAITRVDRLDPRDPVDLLFAEGGVALVQRRARPPQ